MNLTKRQRRLAAKQEFAQPEYDFEKVDLTGMMHCPPGMTRAYRNNRYTIMIFDNHATSHGPAIRVMVQRHDDEPIPRHWKEMFRIKNEIFGYETVAVEYYPAIHQLIDDHNIYWMWIYPKGVLPIPHV